MNWTESPKHEYGSFIASHKHRRLFSVMVKVPVCKASNLNSIPGQVSDFVFVNLIWLNTSN